MHHARARSQHARARSRATARPRGPASRHDPTLVGSRSAAKKRHAFSIERFSRSNANARRVVRRSAPDAEESDVRNGTHIARPRSMLARSYWKLRAYLRIGAGLAIVTAIDLAVAIAKPHRAHAEGTEADKAEANERCAIRLSIAVLGKSPAADLLSS